MFWCSSRGRPRRLVCGTRVKARWGLFVLCEQRWNTVSNSRCFRICCTGQGGQPLDTGAQRQNALSIYFVSPQRSFDYRSAATALMFCGPGHRPLCAASRCRCRGPERGVLSSAVHGSNAWCSPAALRGPSSPTEPHPLAAVDMGVPAVSKRCGCSVTVSRWAVRDTSSTRGTSLISQANYLTKLRAPEHAWFLSS